MPKINLEELKKFLYSANANGYAGDGHEVASQRPGFIDLEYQENDWLFHDSYSGHFFAPGQEVVYYSGKPVWAMAYAGGMEFEYHGDVEVTHQAFLFLKKALLQMDPANPYRGPGEYIEKEWRYVSTLTGDIRDFSGNEKIYRNDILIFEQNFIGGIIV